MRSRRFAAGFVCAGIQVALGLLLVSTGCFVEFGEAPPSPGDGGVSWTDAAASCDCWIDGVCRGAGATDPADPCRECRPERASDAWSEMCPHQLTESTFEDFRDGTMPRSLGNLYISADGAIRIVRSGDLNEDGFFDLVFPNARDDEGFEVPSYVYWGSADGFSQSRRGELPTIGAVGCSVADLNVDGFLDLVFSNSGSDSVIYWGSPEGFDPARRTELPTMTAVGNAVADLDADGFLDIVFSNTSDGETTMVDSHVYWGTAAGFSDAQRSGLPTAGARGVTAADIDGDGYLDLVFSNVTGGGGGAEPEGDSYVYWGSFEGFSSSRRTDLITAEAGGNTVADVDGDGFLDIVFANGAVNWPSYVYWGSIDGLAVDRRTTLVTISALGVSAADLDRDGRLELVFSNWGSYDSYVYWSSAEGISVLDRTYLPTIQADGNFITDLDGDGFLDVTFMNHHDGASFEIDSYIYWGSAAGFSEGNRTSLPTLGADFGPEADLGNVYDRRPEEEYVSSVVDLGEGASPTGVAVAADTPLGSSVSLQLRSATERAAVTSAPWLGPGGADTELDRPFARLSPAHAGHRFVQYRAVFRTPGFLGRPALHSVTIHWE